MQGDVESVASKNPKEFTVLLEQISGSDELKRDYEKYEEEKARAEEQSALVYTKKRTIVSERKQKKEQKEHKEEENAKKRKRKEEQDKRSEKYKNACERIGTTTISAAWTGQVSFTNFSPVELKAGPDLKTITVPVQQERQKQGL